MYKHGVVKNTIIVGMLLLGLTGFVYQSENKVYSITSVEDLSDVDSNKWAYDSLKELVEKYNVIEGYPDKTFKGDHVATRYELAAALNAVVKYIGKDIARLGAEKADKADLEKIARLQEDLKSELNQLQSRSEALEDRTAKSEVKNEEQDNRLSVLEKLKIYGDMSIGMLFDVADRGGTGTPFAGQGKWISSPGVTPNPTMFVRTHSNVVEGSSNASTVLGRVRINVDYPIVEDTDGEGVVGEGYIHTRLVSAFGRGVKLVSQRDLNRTTTGAAMVPQMSSIGGDASLFNEGVRTSYRQIGLGTQAGVNTSILSGLDTRANTYVDSMYYTQHFRSGIPILTDLLPGIDLLPDNDDWRTSLKVTAGVVPWREIFQQSPYGGDDLDQFQNTNLMNNPVTLAVNTISPMVAFQWHQGLGKKYSLDFKTALSALDVSDVMSALAVSWEASINHSFLHYITKYLDKPGNIYVGGYFINSRGGSNSLGTLVTGLTGRTLGYNEDFIRGLSNDPAATIFNAWGLSPAVGGPLAAATQGNLDLLSVSMGLPAGSLNSNVALANSLGLTVAQLRTPEVALPQATINAINNNISNFNAAPPVPGGKIPIMPPGTTLAQYINELRVNGVLANNNIFLQNQNVTTFGDTTLGNFDDSDNAKGLYVGLNQELYRGIGFYATYGVTDTGSMSIITQALNNHSGLNAVYSGAAGMLGSNLYGVKQAFNGGMKIPIRALGLPFRKNDIFGGGFSAVHQNQAFGTTFSGTRAMWGTVGSNTDDNFYYNPARAQWDGVQWVYPQKKLAEISGTEFTMELYYQMNINDRFSIIPSFQAVIHAFGDESNDLLAVFGLRSTFKF